MKITILFGTDSEFQRLDHHELIEKWSIHQMFCTNDLTIDFITKIRDLTLHPYHAVIRANDPKINQLLINDIYRTFHKITIVPVQTLLKPRRVPVLPFMPRMQGKSHYATQIAELFANNPIVTGVWVDEADQLTTADILNTFRTQVKAVLESDHGPSKCTIGAWDASLIPWDALEVGPEVETVRDQIRQKQIQAIMNFEREYPGVEWEIYSGPVTVTADATYCRGKGMDEYRDSYQFAIRPKHKVVINTKV